MKCVMVVAPHPDDETLGCGGTLLNHSRLGDQIHWVIVSGMTDPVKYSSEHVEGRNIEIKEVAKRLGIASIHALNYPAARLDTAPLEGLVQSLGSLISQNEPEVIYAPYRSDIHTDHRIVFDMVASCSKWFRYPSVKRILVYETISETEFCVNPDANRFQPNVFVNIEPYLDKKIDVFRLYSSEIGDFPFPRSEQAIRALAMLRGASVGCSAAEAFMLLREIQ